MVDVPLIKFPQIARHVDGCLSSQDSDGGGMKVKSSRLT